MTAITVTKVDKNIFVHNDLANAAFYFKERIKERVAKKDREGIGHEMIACLTLLAFTVEAQFNFLGYKLVADWNERDTALNKVHAVLKALDVDNDLKAAPFKTITQLKDFRDKLAHGKPKEVKWEGEAQITEAALATLGALATDYEALLTEALVFEAHDHVDAIWKDLLTKSGLSISDTITHSGIEYTIVEPAG